MIRGIAQAASLFAAMVDCVGAWLDWKQGTHGIPLRWAAFVTAAALAPCALAFLAAVTLRLRQPGRERGPVQAIDTLRLPLTVPRGYVGAAVLGGMATLAAMGEGFGLYIFLAGVALMALALSQARPRGVRFGATGA